MNRDKTQWSGIQMESEEIHDCLVEDITKLKVQFHHYKTKKVFRVVICQ